MNFVLKSIYFSLVLFGYAIGFSAWPSFFGFIFIVASTFLLWLFFTRNDPPNPITKDEQRKRSQKSEQYWEQYNKKLDEKNKVLNKLKKEIIDLEKKLKISNPLYKRHKVEGNILRPTTQYNVDLIDTLSKTKLERYKKKLLEIEKNSD